MGKSNFKGNSNSKGNSKKVVSGTNNDDTLVAEPSVKTLKINGGDGNDTLVGTDGGDIFRAGDGDDFITGGRGDSAG